MGKFSSCQQRFEEMQATIECSLESIRKLEQQVCLLERSLRRLELISNTHECVELHTVDLEYGVKARRLIKEGYTMAYRPQNYSELWIKIKKGA